MHLPLREDFSENKAVFQCISQLYQLGAPQLTDHVDRVVLAAADIIGTKKVEDNGEIKLYIQTCFKRAKI